MVEHDSMCQNSKGSCCPWMPSECYCQCMCDYIAEIRADEREKAVIRVLATMPLPASYNTVNAVYAAAAAVRGES